MDRDLPITEAGRGKTVGVQTVVLCSILLPLNSSAIVEAQVAGAQAANVLGHKKTVIAKQVNGVVSIVGVLSALASAADAGVAGTTIDFVANGEEIELQATGIAAKTILWSGLVRGVAHTK